MIKAMIITRTSCAMNDKFRQAFEMVVDKLKSGDLSPIIEFVRVQSNEDTTLPVPADRYSYYNRLLAWLYTGELDVRTYLQWKEVDRYPKAGSHAVYLIRPMTIVQYNEEDAEGERSVKWSGLRFTTFPVFPYGCTEGKPLPVIDTTERVRKQYPDVAGIIESLGIKVDFGDTGKAEGWCTADGTQICLGVTHPKVMYHELSHAVRTHAKRYNIKDYDGEEAIADITAAVLTQVYNGEDVTGETSRYVKAYLGTIEKAIAYLPEISWTIETITSPKEAAHE